MRVPDKSGSSIIGGVFSPLAALPHSVGYGYLEVTYPGKGIFRQWHWKRAGFERGRRKIKINKYSIFWGTLYCVLEILSDTERGWRMHLSTQLGKESVSNL